MSRRYKILALLVWASALAIGWIGGHAYRNSQIPKPPVTDMTCRDEDAGDSTGYPLDLTATPESQGCRTNVNFPNTWLCERQVTVECKLP